MMRRLRLKRKNLRRNMDQDSIVLELENEVSGKKFKKMVVTGHFQHAHDNPGPVLQAQYIYETLQNHPNLNPQGRNEILSATAGLPREFKGWREDYRKTVVDIEASTETVIMVTQYPLNKSEFGRERSAAEVLRMTF